MRHGDITGVILAGGRGSRMGGVDKGLQNFHGMPLALHALLRLQPQVGEMMINANRNLAAYESFGVPVWPDAPGRLCRPARRLPHRAGALRDAVAGDRAVRHAAVPARPGRAAGRRRWSATDAEIAMAGAREEDGAAARRSRCSACCGATLLESLVRFTHGGGRKIDAWTAQHRTVLVPFDRAGDDPRAFFNANTLAELQRLEQRQ